MSFKDWTISTIGDTCENFDSFRKPLSSSEREKIKGKIPYYGAADVIGYISKYLFDGHYVLIAEDGSVINNNGNPIVQNVKGQFWVSNHSHVLKGNNLVSTEYIYYYLKQIKIKPYLTGSVQMKLNQSNLNRIPFRYPSTKVQKSITNILSSLDDKIELNNKINKNLEEIAQTLYKRWFVDFEFPDENGEPYKSNGGEMVDSELGMIPKGWKNEALSSVLDNKRERVGSKDLPVLSAIKEGKLVLSSDFFTKDVPSKNLSKYLVVGQREFSYNPARINIGSIGMNEFDFSGCVSPIYVVLKSENLYVNFFSLYFKMKSFAEEVNLRASGSVRQSLNYDDLGRIMIVYPPRKIITEFNKIYDAIYAILKNNEKLNKKLSNTRDELLPKLMSGEIEVPVEE